MAPSIRDFFAASLPRKAAAFALVCLAVVLIWDPADIRVYADIISMALACGVLVALARPAADAFMAKRGSAVQWYAAGVFLLCLSLVMFRTASFAARNFAPWVANPTFLNVSLFVSIAGAIALLVAPTAIDGRGVPTRAWSRIGMAVALCVLFAAFVLKYRGP